MRSLNTIETRPSCIFVGSTTETFPIRSSMNMGMPSSIPTEQTSGISATDADMHSKWSSITAIGTSPRKIPIRVPCLQEQQELFGPDPSMSSQNIILSRSARIGFPTSGHDLKFGLLRRCRRVLMFHHFAELGGPTLVRSTDFDYRNDPDTLLSFLAADTIWRLELPKAANPFDYSTIADVLLTLEYTALNSFDYRQQVIQTLDPELSVDRPFQFPRAVPGSVVRAEQPRPIGDTYVGALQDHAGGLRAEHRRSVNPAFVALLCPDEEKPVEIRMLASGSKNSVATLGSAVPPIRSMALSARAEPMETSGRRLRAQTSGRGVGIRAANGRYDDQPFQEREDPGHPVRHYLLWTHTRVASLVPRMGRSLSINEE